MAHKEWSKLELAVFVREANLTEVIGVKVEDTVKDLNTQQVTRNKIISNKLIVWNVR